MFSSSCVGMYGPQLAALRPLNHDRGSGERAWRSGYCQYPGTTGLLGDVLDGLINPGQVFDYETDLGHIADAYQAMDQRRAIKSLVRVGSI